jgi:septal ring factor EnvC (AmiA/AmiB activator)
MLASIDATLSRSRDAVFGGEGGSMSRLDKARQRLQDSVARLERAAEKSRARAAERSELARALDAARAEGKTLRETSATLSTRLDSVIGRLKSVIDA